jgi:Na+/phosphate symporter
LAGYIVSSDIFEKMFNNYSEDLDAAIAVVKTPDITLQKQMASSQMQVRDSSRRHCNRRKQWRTIPV